MSHSPRTARKKWNGSSLNRIIGTLAFILLGTVMLTACDSVPSISGNGSSNGTGNSNGNPTGNCNGTGNTCNFGKSGPSQENASNNTNAGNRTSSMPTTISSNKVPINGNNGQEFSGDDTVRGPAIVEWWNGRTPNAQEINCGVFKLSAGQSFHWTSRGHFWEYASDGAVTLNWNGHVADYKAKSENTYCTVGGPPAQ